MGKGWPAIVVPTAESDMLPCPTAPRHELVRRLEETAAALAARTRELSETQRIAKLGTFRWDVETQNFEWSDELHELAGRSRETFVPTLAATLACVVEEDREAVYTALVASSDDDAKPSVEFRVTMPDGSVRDWWGISDRELDETGRCVRLVGICQDISEIKEAEAKLRESEENLRYTIDLNPHIPWMADPDGLIVDIGPRLFETTGASQQEALGSSWLEMLHPDDVESTVAVWTQSVISGQPVITEYRLRTADGSYRWCRASAGARRDSEGNILRWYGTVEDIHDSKLAEAARRETEALNRGILEISPDSIILLDDQGRIVFLNPKGAEHLRRPGNEAIGDRWLRLMSPRLRKQGRVALAQASEGRPARFTGKEAPSEGGRWWDTSITPILGETPGRFLVVSRDVSDSKIAEDRLRWLANHDTLTQLPNRLLLQQKLDDHLAAPAPGRAPLALLLFDLDDFKRTNDTLGHDAGDALLCAFASRLLRAKRPDDFVARLGGDEFALVLYGVGSSEEAHRAYERISGSLREPCIYAGGILECNASVGASLFPQHGTTRADLMKRADIALYAAKFDGGSAIRTFEPAMQADMQRRFNMLTLAKDALDKNWVEPFYQPKFDLQTGALIGFEALLRCRQPERGILGPDKIEAAFQDLDLAARISDRIIDRVIADMTRWRAHGVSFGHVAVNAAAAEFRRGRFAEQLLEKLAGAGVPPECLQVEVTETVFLGRGAEYVETALRTLSQAGVRIALDDFGTGFASLSHLKRFPVDIIKIDRSFVRDLHHDPDDAAIINAVIQLSRSLGISVVAEGIETPAQHQFLLDAGCDIGQGFLYSQAIPAAAVAGMSGFSAARGALAA